MADTAKLVAVIEARTASFERALKKIETQSSQTFNRTAASTRRMNAALDASAAKANRLQTAIGGIGRGAVGGLLGGAAAAISIERVGAAVLKTVETASGLKDLADKIGITTTALQELQYQAEQNGSSAETMGNALEQFSRRVGQAANGSGELAKILKNNNIELRNADGSMRPLVDLLRDYADLMDRAASEQEKGALSAAAFGKANDEMINATRGGAAAMAKSAEDAHRFGQVMRDDAIQGLDKFGDRLEILKGRWNTFWTEAVFFALSSLEQIGAAEHAVIDPILEGMASLQERLNATPEGGSAVSRLFQALSDGADELSEKSREAGEQIDQMESQVLQLEDQIRAAQQSMGMGFVHEDQIAADIARIERLREAIARLRFEQARANALIEFRAGHATPSGGGTPAPTPSQATGNSLAFNVAAKSVATPATTTGATGRGVGSGAAAPMSIESVMSGSVSRELDQINRKLDEATRRAESFGQTIADALADIIIDGRDAREVIAQLAQQLARMLMQSAVSGFFGRVGGGLGGMLGFGGAAMAGPGGLAAMAPPSISAPPVGGGGGGRRIHITHNVNVSGARGDREIVAMVRATSIAATNQTFREMERGLPARVFNRQQRGIG